MPWRPHRKAAQPGTSFQKPDPRKAEGAGWAQRAVEASGLLTAGQSPRLPLGPLGDAKFPVLKDADTALASDPSAQKKPCSESLRSQLACVKAGLRSQKCSPLIPCALGAARSKDEGPALACHCPGALSLSDALGAHS